MAFLGCKVTQVNQGDSRLLRISSTFPKKKTGQSSSVRASIRRTRNQILVCSGLGRRSKGGVHLSVEDGEPFHQGGVFFIIDCQTLSKKSSLFKLDVMFTQMEICKVLQNATRKEFSLKSSKVWPFIKNW